MPKWDEYKQEAKSRGALALELFVVTTTPAGPMEKVKEMLPAHLAYQSDLEAAKKLVLAGPISDETGEEMQGAGMIIYRASSMQDARELANGDPMHSSGARGFTLRKWLINEGSLNVSIGLSTGHVGMS